MTEIKSWQAGQEILREEPWVWTLSVAAAPDHCYFCFKHLETAPQPQMTNNRCAGCKLAKYCSVECQKNDWVDSHKLICQALKRIMTSGIASEYKLLKVVAKFVLSPASVAPLFQFTSPRLALHLKEARRDRQVISMLRNTTLDFLKLKTELRAAVDLDRFLEIDARVSFLTIPIMGRHLTEIGHGIYLKASTIEHSCAPNACYSFVDKRVRVMALHDVANVDQVRVSHVDTLRPREVRQHILKRVSVDCRCALCADPAKDAERHCMPCVNPKCDAKIPSDQRANEACISCGAKPQNNRLKELCGVYNELYAFTFMWQLDPDRATTMQRLQKKMQQVFHPTNPLWLIAYVEKPFELLTQKMPGWAAQARKALELYRSNLSPLDPRIGYWSYHVGQAAMDDPRVALALLEEASRMLNKMLGTDHQMALLATVSYKTLRDGPH